MTTRTKIDLRDLFVGPDGKLSHLKLWNNIAAALFTAVIIRKEWITQNLNDDLLIWYGGMLIAGVVINKGVTLTKSKTATRVD